MKYTIVIILLFIGITLPAQNADFLLLKKIYRDSSHSGVGFFRAISNSVSYVNIASPAVLYLYGHNNDAPVLKREAFKTGSALLLAGGISGLIKIAAKRKRPYIKYPNDFVPGQKTGPHSFPSGHTAMAFANATAVSLATKEPGVIIPSFIWAGAVSYSRMYLGVHFPSDILGGMIIGVGAGVIIWQLDELIQKN
jgi:undecaprenyl-diphosphatase